MKKAAARIKINKLLENAGWRFFADAKGPANIQLDPSLKLTAQALDEIGENFEKASKDFIAASVEAGQWDRVIDYVNKEVFDKPAEFYTLDKLRKAAAVDRCLTLREILEKIFCLIPRIIPEYIKDYVSLNQFAA